MTETNSLQSLRENSDKIVISKLEILKALLGVSIPVDEQMSYTEGTRYVAAFNSDERGKIKKRIMSLIDKL